MDIPNQLRCLFSATVEQRDESYIVEVPKQEIRVGSIEEGETVRIGVLPSLSDEETEQADTEQQRAQSAQPVEEGDTRTVEIESLGDQGDGIARVERGFVVIVPDTDQGERVTVEITDVTENVAFADVVERLSYYD